MTVERKLESIWWSRLSRAVAFVLFCLFAAPAAQAMLLELQFHWDVSSPDDLKTSAYNLQLGSIIQVIAYDSTAIGVDAPNKEIQFEKYGRTSESASAQPYTTGHIPTDDDVFLADTTQKGHDIVYTGSLQDLGTGDDHWYGLYTQITIDTDVYDTVYVRVFGASSIEPGQVTASYWGISGTNHLSPTFQFQSYKLENQHADADKNYFEVIPEPATLGLLGLGGCALAAWRRRRPRRQEEDNR